MPTVTITSSEHASHRLHGFPPVLSNFIILSCVVFLPCENTKKILHFGKKTVILHKKSSVWGLTCGWQHGAGPPGVFRKAVFCIAKGHQSHAERPPFAGQKTAFYKSSGNVLTVSELRFAVKTTPRQPERKTRVRFAPSPTGALHIGGVRTALYNYLFARQRGGEMVFRIEDTDSSRFVPGAEEYIIESFRWLGIKFDEGVSFGGSHGPYRQSERRSIYKKYVDQLLADGKAYIAFDTPEELEAKRQEIKNFQYDAHTRHLMRNSLTMPKEEVDALIADGVQYVVRFKVEPGEDVHVNDMIRGDVVIKSDILDDKVLYKSADELPTYHLANIVDDHLMEITHVIRGEEWLPSAPLHVLLYRAFGWEDTMPRFAHLPLLLKPDGKGKLSKRDGDRLGFPVFPLEWHDPKTGEVSNGFREQGYFPEAVINFLALLGWNPGTEQELFTLDELVEQFDIAKCSKAGARFDYKKAVWFNHEYILKKSDDEIAGLFAPIVAGNGVDETALTS